MNNAGRIINHIKVGMEKMRIKYTTVLTVIAIALLCSCGDEKRNSEEKRSRLSDTYESIEILEENSQLELSKTEDKDEAEKQSEDLWSGDKLLSIGTVNGYTYENEFLGYGCTLENWNIADESDLAEANHIAVEEWDSDIQDLIKNSGTYIDMYAESMDGLCNINIQFQDGSYFFGMKNGDDSERELLENVIQSMPQYMEKAGYTDINMELTKILLDGTEFNGIATKASLQGIPIFQKQICMMCPDYNIFITVSTLENDNVDDIFSKFYKLSDEGNSMNVYHIVPEKYPWGTTYEEIKNAEISGDMVEGNDYGYYERTSDGFAKELIVDDYIKDYLFGTHYSFDDNEKLVSTMYVFSEVQSDLTIINLFLDLIEDYTKKYGEAEYTFNPYGEKENGSIEDYLKAITENGLNSIYIWSDDESNQLIVSCYMGEKYLELVLLFNSKGYSIDMNFPDFE